MIVDGHLHVFQPHSARYPRVVDELAPASRAAPAEELLATLDAYGVDRAVAVPLGSEDDYLAECLRRWPDRFAGVAVADDATLGRMDGVDSVRRLEERRERAGFAGLRTGWLGDPGRPVTDSPAYPLLRHLAAEELLLWFYGPPEQLALVEEATAQLPELRVVLNHLGFCPTGMRVDTHGRPRIDTALPPPTLPRVLDLAERPGVHVMLSGGYAFSRHDPPYSDMSPIVSQLYKAYGAGRMLWASDHPWPTREPGYAHLLELPDQHLPHLTADERAAIRGGTALRLFRTAWTR